jgi:hypothetical protein
VWSFWAEFIKLSAGNRFSCRFIVVFCIFAEKNGAIIAADNLHIDELKVFFASKKSLNTSDIFAFYKVYDPNIKQSTVNWRVYWLVQSGALNRIGRGHFIVGKGNQYLPVIADNIKSIDSQLKKQFPYAKICIWDTSALNEFMNHQPGQFYILVEVERDVVESVFYFLKEARYSVFSNPKKDLLEKYALPGERNLVVKPLVTEAPTQKIDGVNTASLEKMLVDVFCDDVVFSAHQGAEMRTIFKEALVKYSLNFGSMIRYSDRRYKKPAFSKYLSQLTNLRQE